MTVIAFPAAERIEIADPAEVDAIESMICAVAGLIGATGGSAAIAAQDLFETPLATRIALLNRMYQEGEVVFGCRDGRDGGVYNIVIEKLRLPPLGRESWRAEIFVEAADGHASLGTLTDSRIGTVARAVLGSVSQGFSQPLSGGPTAALSLARR
jgi:hypothetical protein